MVKSSKIENFLLVTKIFDLYRREGKLRGIIGGINKHTRVLRALTTCLPLEKVPQKPQKMAKNGK